MSQELAIELLLGSSKREWQPLYLAARILWEAWAEAQGVGHTTDGKAIYDSTLSQPGCVW